MTNGRNSIRDLVARHAPTGGVHAHTRSWLVNLGMLLALFEFIRLLVMRAADLPEASYFRRIIVFDAIARPECLVAIGLFVAIGVITFQKSGSLRWSQSSDGSTLQFVCIATAAPLAWEYSTYGYNFYFDQTHMLDRCLLVVLFVALCRWPVFLVPFAIVVRAIINQLALPLDGFIWAVDDHMIDVLVIAAAGFVVQVIRRRSVSGDVLILICCRIAANYWIPGFAKLKMGFTAINHLHQAVPGAWAHGWLGWLDMHSVVRISNAIQPFDYPLEVAAVLVECSAVVMMFNRRVAVTLLCLWTAFHIGVYFLIGYCFWKWGTLNAVIVIALFRCRIDAFHAPGAYWRVVVCSLLVVTSSLWCQPASLCWYHSRLANTWRIAASCADGTTIELSPAFFTPYDFTFTMNQFAYLSKDPILTHPYGVTSGRTRAHALLKSRTLAEVDNAQTRLGRVQFDVRRSRAFDRFVEQFVTARTRHHAGGSRTRLAPPLLWSARREQQSSFSSPIRMISIRRFQTTFLNHKIIDEPVEHCGNISIDVAIDVASRPATAPTGTSPTDQTRASHDIPNRNSDMATDERCPPSQE